MKIFVTGAFGFIGSHLTQKLLSLGHKVIAFDKYNSFNHWGNLEELKERNYKNLSVLMGDIRDMDMLNSSIKGCDSVIHLAALIGIPYSYVTPIAYIKTNIEGTYNILEASKVNKVSSVIITSTSEVYGSAQYTPMDELHPIVSQSPYSASKTSADNLAISYFKSFNLPVKIIRPFNTYGPRQSQRAVIPSIINQGLCGNKINIGNIYSIRDFTYVDDLIGAFIKINNSKKLYGEVLNIGSGNKIKIKDIVDLVSHKLNKKFKINIQNNRIRPKHSEVNQLVCNNLKAKKIINWKPIITFDEGITRYIEWAKEKNFSKSFSKKYYV